MGGLLEVCGRHGTSTTTAACGRKMAFVSPEPCMPTRALQPCRFIVRQLVATRNCVGCMHPVSIYYTILWIRACSAASATRKLAAPPSKRTRLQSPPLRAHSASSPAAVLIARELWPVRPELVSYS